MDHYAEIGFASLSPSCPRQRNSLKKLPQQRDVRVIAPLMVEALQSTALFLILTRDCASFSAVNK